MLSHVLPDAVDGLPDLVSGIAVGVGLAVLVSWAGRVPARSPAPVSAVHLPLLSIKSLAL